MIPDESTINKDFTDSELHFIEQVIEEDQREDIEGTNYMSEHVDDEVDKRKHKHKHKKNLWLFDIVSDPNEELDLSDKRPDVVRSMLDRLQYHSKTSVKAQSHHGDDKANPEKHGGAWQPWRD